MSGWSAAPAPRRPARRARDRARFGGRILSRARQTWSADEENVKALAHFDSLFESSLSEGGDHFVAGGAFEHGHNLGHHRPEAAAAENFDLGGMHRDALATATRIAPFAIAPASPVFMLSPSCCIYRSTLRYALASPGRANVGSDPALTNQLLPLSASVRTVAARAVGP